MAISTTEATRLFNKLATQLRERGASTLVDQVIDEIAQGKQIIYKTIRQRTAAKQLYRPEADEVFLERGRRREYAETLDYSAQERLDLLIQALERAILDTAQIEAELLAHHKKVRFLPEQQEETARSFELGSLVSHLPEAEHLRGLLANLREVIEA